VVVVGGAFVVVGGAFVVVVAALVVLVEVVGDRAGVAGRHEASTTAPTTTVTRRSRRRRMRWYRHPGDNSLKHDGTERHRGTGNVVLR